MREVYRSKKYAPEIVVKRYVRYFPYHAGFRVYEVDIKKNTVREYDTADLPETVKNAAIEGCDKAFGAVEWN
jgi:hypothetical protein